MTTCISVLSRAASRHYALLFRGKLFKTRLSALPEQDITTLRLTEVVALMSTDLCARSQTPLSLPSSPSHESMLGIMAGNAGNTPT